MEERIRFITYKGKRVLLVDVSNCTTAEMIKLASLLPTHLSGEPRGSVLLLADFTGSKFDKAAFESLKQATVYYRPHIKRSPWCGTAALPKIVHKTLQPCSH